MDTTAKYIKMCDCPEIQGQLENFRGENLDHLNLVWVRQYAHYCTNCKIWGDYSSWISDGTGVVLDTPLFCQGCGKRMINKISVEYLDEMFTGATEDLFENGKESVWLLRQDQLQGMAKEKDLHELLDNMNVWRCNQETGCVWNYQYQFKTGEQLWLAFVMHEKFQKIWSISEEKWVNIK